VAEVAKVADRTGRDRANGRQFWLDPRLTTDPEVLPWSAAQRRLAQDPAAFRGRWVLIGATATAAGDDVHRVPSRHGGSQPVAGLVLQARLVDTLAGGCPLRDAPPAAVRLAGALLALFGALRVNPRAHVGSALAVLGGLSSIWLALTAATLWSVYLIVPVTNGLLALWAAGLAAFGARLGLPAKPLALGSVDST